MRPPRAPSLFLAFPLLALCSVATGLPAQTSPQTSPQTSLDQLSPELRRSLREAVIESSYGVFRTGRPVPWRRRTQLRACAARSAPAAFRSPAWAARAALGASSSSSRPGAARTRCIPWPRPSRWPPRAPGGASSTAAARWWSGTRTRPAASSRASPSRCLRLAPAFRALSRSVSPCRSAGGSRRRSCRASATRSSWTPKAGRSCTTRGCGPGMPTGASSGQRSSSRAVGW